MKMPEGFEALIQECNGAPGGANFVKALKIMKEMAEALESACESLALEYGCDVEQCGEYNALKKFKDWT